MTNQSTESTTGRRGFLTTIGAIGSTVLAGQVSGADSRVVEVNVGYTTKNGLDAALGAAVETRHRFAFDALTVRVPVSALSELAARSDVRYVERNRVRASGVPGSQRDLTAAVPGAPPSPQVEAPTGGQILPYGVDRIDADVAHENGFTGAGADVAVLDTGIDSTHPDLEANVGTGRGFVPGIADVRELGFPPGQDDDIVATHGTHCAGTIGAVDDSNGVVGVSTEATLHPVKVLLGVLGGGTDAGIAAGIEYVADQGWDVANLSLGGPEPARVLEDAVIDATDRGVLLVAAAGNEGMMPGDMPASMGTSTVGYPAAYDDVLAVGATNREDELAEFSSTGPEVDLVAPGAGILSTSLPINIRSTPDDPTNRYIRLSGTSFACPHVAGAGALLMAEGYSNAEARDRLTDTAEDIGLSANEGGDGLLDVAAALDLDSDDDLS